MNKPVNISSKKIARALLVTVFFLLTFNLLIIYLSFVRGHEHLRGFIHGFYFDAEANFPSLYSALAILFSAVLLWLIGTSEEEKWEKRSIYWKFLSLVFVFLALDEFGSLHESLIQPVKGIVDRSPVQSDYLYFAWFIPYVLLVIVVGLVVIRFFFKLPVRLAAT